jgi:hypothetical protein
MLTAPTMSRWACRPQVEQEKFLPLGLGTRLAQFGQVDEVPRSSTRLTSMPAAYALSVNTLMSCPKRQLRTARF